MDLVLDNLSFESRWSKDYAQRTPFESWLRFSFLTNFFRYIHWYVLLSDRRGVGRWKIGCWRDYCLAS